MAGLAERQSHSDDSFWTWREVMYAFAGRIGPDELRAIAAQLYVEMLKAGYTQVCEFHYLHHQPDGRPYADPAAMSLALIEAAREAGIGITLLPTLYMTGGFDGRPLSDRQRRFRFDLDGYLGLLERLIALESPLVRVGIALHSLRAVPEAAMRELLESALVPRPCDASQRRGNEPPRRERRHRGTLSDDRGESRRRPLSAETVSRCRRKDRHRIGQSHFGFGRRGIALARRRTAPRDSATQRQRIARVAGHRRDAVPARNRGRCAGVCRADRSARCRFACGFRRAG
jgi:hypothetical protein